MGKSCQGDILYPFNNKNFLSANPSPTVSTLDYDSWDGGEDTAKPLLKNILEDKRFWLEDLIKEVLLKTRKVLRLESIIFNLKL